jgi:hypothetical protein
VLVAEVTVSVEEAAPEVTSTVVGERAHVAGLVAPLGAVTLHVRSTLPVNPFEGVTETVVLFPVVAPAASVRLPGLLVTVKPGISGAFTVTVTAVWEVMLPNVPVVVTV